MPRTGNAVRPLALEAERRWQHTLPAPQRPILRDEFSLPLHRVRSSRQYRVEKLPWPTGGHPGEGPSSGSEHVERWVEVLFGALKIIDGPTAAHSVRVTSLALRFAHHLGLSAEELETLEIAGTLHDIGKIAIAAHILHKPEPLAPEEREIIRRHPIIGKTIVEMLGLTHQKRLVLHHHEHWNGRGYPHGLAGNEIPLLCQVVCLADSYDALISDRPYRKGCTHRQALEEIRVSAGTQFSPELTKEFIGMFH